MVLHCLESKKGPGKGASLFVAVKAASEAVCCSGGVVSTHGGWRAAGGASKPEAAAHTVRNSLLAAFSCTTEAGAVQCGNALARAGAYARARRAITPMLWLEDVGVSRSEN